LNRRGRRGRGERGEILGGAGLFKLSIISQYCW
jgi:hypothetical protein